MKQTLEEKAYDYAKEKMKFRKDVLKEVDADNYVSRHADCMEDFQCGYNCRKEESPWISVEEQPANIYDDFLVTDGKKIYKAYNNGNNKWYIADRLDKYRLEGIIAYMPIPSFDEILEANRDVLERIKEKGD